MEETTREKVLASFVNVPWDDYVRARSFLTQQEVDLMRKMQEDSLDFTLAEQDQARDLAAALVKVLEVITNDITAQQFAITRIEDILSGKSDLGPPSAAEVTAPDDLTARAKLFQDGTGAFNDRPFLAIMQRTNQDLYCTRVASLCLARLLVASNMPVDQFISWACEHLQSSRQSSEMRTAVTALTILLRRVDSRNEFRRHGGVGHLTRLLKTQGTGANAQLLYEVTFCLWTLSFCDEVQSDFTMHGAVSVLVEQVTAAPREKVVRVSLATLRNLAEADSEVITTIIACGLMKALRNMRDRQWSDPDIKDDVEAVYTLLNNNYRELSTFDRWVAEVMSRRLKWGSLVHEEKFWRENARCLEDNDFELLKALIGLLKSEDNEVVSVACYDLGEFVRFYPNGRSIVKNLGAKDLVMLKINDEEPEVQRHALQCMSKIMVNHWEFMR
uniref:V-type proton ATPase subunit H n=1 Tax=Rhizochromulina marina TaxID=1034831 RepID=A0A7S2SKW2_9STRA